LKIKHQGNASLIVAAGNPLPIVANSRMLIVSVLKITVNRSFVFSRARMLSRFRTDERSGGKQPVLPDGFDLPRPRHGPIRVARSVPQASRAAADLLKISATDVSGSEQIAKFG